MLNNLMKIIFSGLPIYYWKSKEEAEVDFLVETDYDGVSPIEELKIALS